MKTTACLIIAIILATMYLSDAGEQDTTNGCNTNCSSDPTALTKQICATNDEGKTKIFPSECVMRSENCLNKSRYVETGPAEGGSCP